MRHPWLAPVLLILAAFVGYAAASRPVQAQAEQWPFSSGEVITLTLPGGGTHRCSVEEIKGTFGCVGRPSANPSASASVSARKNGLSPNV